MYTKKAKINFQASTRSAAVDALLEVKRNEAGLEANGPAAKAELVRRVTYGLTGLAPTPEEVAAFVVLQDAADPGDLIEHCRASLASYKVPREIFVVSQLPKSSIGKVLKSELVDRLPKISKSRR